MTFSDGPGGGERHAAPGRVAIACDGINSVLRKQFYPGESEPRYSGVNMWRGVTRWTPILSGASMIRAGIFTGRLVQELVKEGAMPVCDSYPIRELRWHVSVSEVRIIPMLALLRSLSRWRAGYRI